MLFLNDPPCFIPEKYAADMETDFNPYNLRRIQEINESPAEDRKERPLMVRKGRRGDTEKRYRESVKKGSTAKAP